MAHVVGNNSSEPGAATAACPADQAWSRRQTAGGLGSLLGSSQVMQQVFRLIESVGPTQAGVLFTGESGSGKELAARLVHDCSPRRRGPFVVVKCGAVSAGLMEAELFGCDAVAGVNTAAHPRAGAFERAQGGTLLLDEVTEMPLDMQSRLLRTLETRSYFPVGSGVERAADVRVIAATNRCPLSAVQAGQLREDLLYRLAVFPIDMPPLRKRADDAQLLAERFLDDLNVRNGAQKRLSAQARLTLKQHVWPGNVRELKNCIERAFILGDETLELSPLSQSPAAGDEFAFGVARDAGRLDIRVGARIHDMERSLIEATLHHFKGNKRRAADVLGCSLKTLYNKLNGYSQSGECANT